MRGLALDDRFQEADLLTGPAQAGGRMAQIEWHRTRNVCTKRICAIASGPEPCAAF